MINDELLEKFNSIEELPFSEEMLGAYLEKRLNSNESILIEKSIESNSLISSMMRDIDISQYSVNTLDEVIENEMIDLEDMDLFIDKYNSEINNNMEKMNRAYSTYGESGENVNDPVYILQPDDHSCALRSQQIVLRDFGIDIPFDKLEQLAKEYGVYTDGGTYTYDIGKVLQIAGVGMHQVEGTSFMDLTNELAQGHRVIVSVDSNELWHNDSFTEKLKNWFDDTFGEQGGNHALIVAGVEVNLQNPDDVKVVLTDPGAGDLRIEYPLDQFMDAWKDSNCFMAATDNPAPYQYDAETRMEVPSNFAVQQYINEFVASHGYKLSPDMINIPQDYQPTFTDHLSLVGNLKYSEFEDNYQEYIDTHVSSDLSIKEQIEEMAKSLMDPEYHKKTLEEDGKEDENDDENNDTTDHDGPHDFDDNENEDTIDNEDDDNDNDNDNDNDEDDDDKDEGDDESNSSDSSIDESDDDAEAE